ncbi:MAG: hypothetical protein ACRCXZ_05240 [Patescibacteria group bacterium]
MQDKLKSFLKSESAASGVFIVLAVFFSFIANKYFMVGTEQILQCPERIASLVLSDAATLAAYAMVGIVVRSFAVMAETSSYMRIILATNGFMAIFYVVSDVAKSHNWF